MPNYAEPPIEFGSFERFYDAATSRLSLASREEAIHALAERLWPPATPPSRNGEAALELRIDVDEGLAPPSDFERRVRWELSAHPFGPVGLELPGALSFRLDPGARSLRGRTTRGALAEAPSAVARLLLETPVAIFLSRTTHDVLHAGAVVGPAGAVVLRGASGAGKSTLVAAAWRAGFGVLGDESLLVSRADADALSSSIRELAILPETEALLGLAGRTVGAFSGGEEKRRVDLFPGSSPDHRLARRAATVFLGPREPGPARLTPLRPSDVLRLFPAGAVPEERLRDDPADVGGRWAEGGRCHFLEGARDLAGALDLLGSLCGKR